MKKAIRHALEALDKVLTPIIAHEDFAGRKEVAEALRWLKVPAEPQELHYKNSLPDLRHAVSTCHHLRDNSTVTTAIDALAQALGGGERSEKPDPHVTARRSVKRLIKAGHEADRLRPGRRPIS